MIKSGAEKPPGEADQVGVKEAVLCNSHWGQWDNAGASSYLLTDRMLQGSSIVAVECNKPHQGHNMAMMYTNSHSFSFDLLGRQYESTITVWDSITLVNGLHPY